MSQIINKDTGEIIADYPGVTLHDAVLNFFNNNNISWIEYMNILEYLEDTWKNNIYFENSTLYNMLSIYPNLGRVTLNHKILLLPDYKRLFVYTRDQYNVPYVWNLILSTIFPDLQVV